MPVASAEWAAVAPFTIYEQHVGGADVSPICRTDAKSVRYSVPRRHGLPFRAVTCEFCDKPLPKRPGPGRKQRFCNSTCRSAARRLRTVVNSSLTPGDGRATLDEVRDVHRQVLEAQESLRAAVDRARAGGHTWQEIGDVVGTTRQAAFQRFGRPLDPRTGEPLSVATLPGAGEKALGLLTDLAAARFDRARGDFDDTMQRELDVTALASVWAMVVGSVGAFERFGEPVVHAAGGFTVVDVLMHFEAGQATGQVSFRDEGTVAGLFIRPA
jgi:hypothetical protein